VVNEATRRASRKGQLRKGAWPPRRERRRGGWAEEIRSRITITIKSKSGSRITITIEAQRRMVGKMAIMRLKGAKGLVG